MVEYERATLMALYGYAVEHPKTSVFADELPEVVGCGGQLAVACVDSLQEQGFIERINIAGRSAVRMTRNGFCAVDDWPDDIYVRASNVFGSESQGLGQPAQFNDGEVPASDRTVTLSHNQPEYQDTVAALDEVIEAFRDDHRLDNELGREKGALLKALEAGRELLNDTVVNVRIGTALLIEPLQRLVVKYEKELVAALASAAIPLVLRLFGLG